MTDAVGVGRRGYYQSLNYLTYGSGSALVYSSYALEVKLTSLIRIGSGIGGLLVQQFGWAWVYKVINECRLCKKH